MRRNRLLHLLLVVAVDLVHTAGASWDMAQDPHVLLMQGACPRLLLPHECHRLRSLLQQSPPAEREGILAEYQMTLREREQACRCETEAGSVISLPAPESAARAD